MSEPSTETKTAQSEVMQDFPSELNFLNLLQKMRSLSKECQSIFKVYDDFFKNQFKKSTVNASALTTIVNENFENMNLMEDNIKKLISLKSQENKEQDDKLDLIRNSIKTETLKVLKLKSSRERYNESLRLNQTEKDGLAFTKHFFEVVLKSRQEEIDKLDEQIIETKTLNQNLVSRDYYLINQIVEEERVITNLRSEDAYGEKELGKHQSDYLRLSNKIDALKKRRNEILAKLRDNTQMVNNQIKLRTQVFNSLSNELPIIKSELKLRKENADLHAMLKDFNSFFLKFQTKIKIKLIFHDDCSTKEKKIIEPILDKQYKQSLESNQREEKEIEEQCDLLRKKLDQLSRTEKRQNESCRQIESRISEKKREVQLMMIDFRNKTLIMKSFSSLKSVTEDAIENKRQFEQERKEKELLQKRREEEVTLAQEQANAKAMKMKNSNTQVYNDECYYDGSSAIKKSILKNDDKENTKPNEKKRVAFSEELLYKDSNSILNTKSVTNDEQKKLIDSLKPKSASGGSSSTNATVPLKSQNYSNYTNIMSGLSSQSINTGVSVKQAELKASDISISNMFDNDDEYGFGGSNTTTKKRAKKKKEMKVGGLIDFDFLSEASKNITEVEKREKKAARKYF